MKKRLLPVLILILLTSTGSGQDFFTELHYGAGKQEFRKLSDGTEIAAYLTQNVGLVLEFSPYFSMLYVRTGAIYSFSDISSDISFPLSFRLMPRKKISPFVELGASYNYLLSDPDDAYIVKNDFHLTFTAGFNLKIKEKWHLEIGYAYRYGLTPALEEEILLPLDQTLTEEYKARYKGLGISLQYKIY